MHRPIAEGHPVRRLYSRLRPCPYAFVVERYLAVDGTGRVVHGTSREEVDLADVGQPALVLVSLHLAPLLIVLDGPLRLSTGAMKADNDLLGLARFPTLSVLLQHLEGS